MVPRATRNPTPLTATKPANSFVRSSVSRIASALTDNGRPLAPLSFPQPRCASSSRPGPAGSRTGPIAPQPSQYDVGRTVAGHCRGPDRRRRDRSLQGEKGDPPGGGGTAAPAGGGAGGGGGGVDALGCGGTRADLSSGPAIC